MNKKFLSAILFGALMVTSTGTFVSCKDYEDDIKDVQEQVDANKSALAALESQLTSLKSAAEAAKTAADAAAQAAQAAKSAADAAQATGDEALAKAKAAEAAAEQAKAAAEQAKLDAIADATAKVEALKVWVAEQGFATKEELAAAIAVIGGQIEGIEAGLSELTNYALGLQEQINTLNLTALSNIAALQEDLDAQKAALEKLMDSTTDEALALKLEEVIEAIKTIDNNYGQAIGNLEARLNDMDEIFAAKFESQDQFIAQLSQVVNTLVDDVDANAVSINELWAEIETQFKPTLGMLASNIDAIHTNIQTLHVLFTSLRSMVFVPDLYVDGIEATEYTFALGSYLSGAATETVGEVTGNDDKNTPYALAKDEIYGYVSTMMDWTYNPVWTVNYHLNPSNAKVDAKALSFISKDAQSISSRAANASTAEPTVVGATTKDGILTVSYTAKGEAITTKKNMVAMMALQANLKNGEKDTIITSDYAALYPSQVSPYMIAYSKKNIGGEQYACVDNKNEYFHVYPTAMEAIENEATLTVEYNGSLELKDYLCIHYNQSNSILGLNNSNSAGMHKVWAYGEEAQYDLEYKYSLVSYTVGSDDGVQTPENKYAVVDANGHVEPRYVDAQGNQHVSNGTTGVSAIGKKPVVRVEVVDKNTGDVVLGGFVKIEIVRSIAPVVVEPGFDLGKLAYACEWMSKDLTWAQMSGGLLEAAAKTSKAEFEQVYELEKTYAYSEPDSEGANNEWYAIVYVKTEAGEFVRLDSKEAEAMYNTSMNNFYFGYLEEYGNVQGVANDRIVWNTTQWQRDNIYRLENPLTIYVSYVPKAEVGEGTAPRIFVPLTLEIVYPLADYGKKIPEYWYDNETTQRLNVNYPKDGGNTKNYTVDLDNAFEGNSIQFILKNNVDNVFKGNWAEKDYIDYDYFFSWDNDGKAIGDSGYAYYLEGEQETNPYPTELYAKPIKGGSIHLIATVDTEGNVQYAGATAENANDVAKMLLNAWTHDDANNAYAPVVGIKAYSAGCGIKLDDSYKFNARFLRPIDVIGAEDGKFTDADDNGSIVNILDLFNFVDWRDKNFVTSDKKNVWYFGYYNIKNLTVNIDEITTTLSGGKLGETKLSAISSQVVFTQVGGGDVDFTSYNNAESGTNATYKAIKEALGQIKYENNGNNVADFMVRIPVTVTYEWGTINTYVDCAVENTLGNN